MEGGEEYRISGEIKGEKRKKKPDWGRGARRLVKTRGIGGGRGDGASWLDLAGRERGVAVIGV